MKTLAWIASTWAALLFSHAAAEPPRTYTTAVSIFGAEAIRFEIAAPRMTAEEFRKTTETPTIRAALNELHLSRVGRLEAIRPFAIGDLYVEAGGYDVGLEITEDTVFLTLSGDGPAIRVSFERVDGSSHVPQLAVAFLAREPVDEFDLEFRFGDVQGRVALSFDAADVVTGMNNLAWELLRQEDVAIPDGHRALRLAARANEMTGNRVPGVLDTLALAQFRTGDVDAAIVTQKRAIVAIGNENPRLRAALLAQLRQFESGATQR